MRMHQEWAAIWDYGLWQEPPDPGGFNHLQQLLSSILWKFVCMSVILYGYIGISTFAPEIDLHIETALMIIIIDNISKIKILFTKKK